MNDILKYLDALLDDYNDKKESIDLNSAIKLEDLVALAQSPNVLEKARKGALLHLLLTKTDSASQLLMKILRRDFEHGYKHFMVDVLCQYKNSKMLEIMIYLVLKGSLLYRKNLLIATAEVAHHDNAPLKKLLHRFLLYGDQNTKSAAAIAIGHFGNSSLVDDVIYVTCKEQNEQVKISLIEAMKLLKDTRTLEILNYISTNDNTTSIRKKAIAAIAAIEQ